MSKRILPVTSFFGGISDSEKVGTTGTCFASRNINIFDEPTQITLNPATSKVSGSTVTELIKWTKEATPHNTKIYFYGDQGGIYVCDFDGTNWSLLQATSNSGGQGLEVHDDYLYYTQNTQIGRYGPLSGAAAFTDAWQTGLNDTSSSIQTANFAPIKAFRAGFAVGNGNDLGWWDGAVWTQNRIILPPGFNIRTLDVIDEFLVIGAWRGAAITDTEQGYAFFWDGDSTTFNHFVEIPEGGINAMLNSRNRLISMVGSSGILYLNYSPFQKVQKVPFVPISKSVELFPGAMTNWKGIAHMGIAGITDSDTLQAGVYQYGARSDRYPEGWVIGYTLSTGLTTGTSIQIGSVHGIGAQMYIGWRNGASYGVDRVSIASNPFASGTWESLIFDDERPFDEKQALVLKVTHKALASGESLQLGYKTNRATSYTTGTANSTVGSTQTRLIIPPADARFYEFQFEIILATSGATSPTVTSAALLYDDLLEEEDF